MMVVGIVEEEEEEEEKEMVVVVMEEEMVVVGMEEEMVAVAMEEEMVVVAPFWNNMWDTKTRPTALGGSLVASIHTSGFLPKRPTQSMNRNYWESSLPSCTGSTCSTDEK